MVLILTCHYFNKQADQRKWEVGMATHVSVFCSNSYILKMTINFSVSTAWSSLCVFAADSISYLH